MSNVKLELQRWGEFQAERYVRPKASEDGPGTHPLARAREFAPETRERAQKLLAGRDGRARRSIMGANGSAIAGGAMSPQWASDPIPCTETRTPGPPMASFDKGVPADYAWVEPMLGRLARSCPVQAAVVRAEFTMQASQRAKAQYVSREAGVTVSKWQYRRYLALGLAFVMGNRA